jgi:acylphosphatase
MERREVFYSGQVQGVGFRYRTTQVAARFDVVGFVENLPDGRVHLAAEGTKNELNAFLDAVNEALAGNKNRRRIEK